MSYLTGVVELLSAHSNTIALNRLYGLFSGVEILEKALSFFCAISTDSSLRGSTFYDFQRLLASLHVDTVLLGMLVQHSI